MNLDEIKALVRQDLLGINQLIEQHLSTDIQLIKEMLGHIIGSGGKRLRPLIVLLTSRAFGYMEPAHITLATLIEFIHTATLLHDDVVDDSTLRRGAETANTIWGNEASVLIGDFLFSRSFQMMIELQNLPIMAILSKVTNQLAEGEVIQLMNRHNSEISEELYMDVIHSKTAMLFAGATQCSAILCKQSPETVQDLFNYGFHLGTAFQLADDALDYTGDKNQLGKNIGDDLIEGKTTLPLLYALRQGTPAEQKAIRESIQEGTLNNLDIIQETIASTKAIEYTYRIAKNQIELAVEGLKSVPDSIYRQALCDIANFAIDRRF